MSLWKWKLDQQKRGFSSNPTLPIFFLTLPLQYLDFITLVRYFPEFGWHWCRLVNFHLSTYICICLILKVQLTRSLSKVKREDTQKTIDRQSSTAGIPLVRLTKEDITHGLLTERQRTWADGFPNDPYVENPVLHKYVLKKILKYMLFSTCTWLYWMTYKMINIDLHINIHVRYV